jgi:hypothetical protein
VAEGEPDIYIVLSWTVGSTIATITTVATGATMTTIATMAAT